MWLVIRERDGADDMVKDERESSTLGGEIVKGVAKIRGVRMGLVTARDKAAFSREMSGEF